VTGFAVDAIGWSTFFLVTMVLGIPGLVMLARFVPPGVREPDFSDEPVDIQAAQAPLTRSQIATRGLIGAVLMGTGALLLVALLTALRVMRSTTAAGFDFGGALRLVANPAGIADWVQLVGIATFAVFGGLFVAAAVAARRGIAQS
jgi:PAT family beta-lactamase induction signal transducer AmpG